MIEIITLILIPLIGSMFLMVPIWFVVISKYFRYLRENHSELYKEMGEPSLFMNNTPSNTVSFLRYVCGNKYLRSEDRQLISKSLFLKRFFYTYLVIFISVIIGFVSISSSLKGKVI